MRKELIARLEAAAEGSRELNVALYAVAHDYEFRFREDHDTEMRVTKCQCWEQHLHEPDGSHWQTMGAGTSGPDYSGSIDAALPGENIVMMSFQRPRPGQPSRWCALDANGKEAGYGNTEALARRIAALEPEAR